MRIPFLRRSAARDAQTPPPTDPATLAGARQLGNDGGSGHVPAHRAFTDVDAGGRVDDLGRFVVAPSGVLDAMRTPESWYADRPLYGGVRTAGAFNEYRDEPGNTGGHQVITGRVPFVWGEAVIEPAPAPSFREPPRPESCRRIPIVDATPERVA